MPNAQKTRHPKDLQSLGVDPVVRMNLVKAIVSLSEAQIYKMIAEGNFPRPFPIIPNGRLKGWRLSAVANYLATREQASTSPAGTTVGSREPQDGRTP